MRIDKDNIKIVLILLVVALGIGYSYLNTELNINGTANINSANWNVYWNNVQVTNGSVAAETPTIDTNKTTVSFNVTLAKPGDFYEFTVDAVNAGTLDAMIDTINSKLNGTTITTLPAYLEYNVTYSGGTPLEPNQELLHDTTETYKIRIAYKGNISASDLPDTNQSLSLQFSVTYKQADDNAQPVDHRTTVYTVSSTNSYIGQAIPNDITQYSSASEAMAAFSNHPCYIKHIIRNGVIDESYVEFVVTQAMANANSGMTAGTYALRGLNIYDKASLDCISEYFDTTNNICLSPYYESNKETLLQAFGSSNCRSEYDGSDYDGGNYKSFTCRVSGFVGYVDTRSNVQIDDNVGGCYVRGYGESYCEG